MWAQPETLNGIISQYTVYCAESSTSSGDGLSPDIETGSDLSSTSSGDGLSPDIETGSDFVSASTNNTSLILTGLRPYSQYDCFISANTSAGESELSAMISAITEQSGKL